LTIEIIFNNTLSSSTDYQPAEDRYSGSYLQIRAAQLEDASAVAEILADSFHSKEGMLGWAYPLLRLGIYEDVQSRLRTSPPHHACLVAANGTAIDKAGKLCSSKETLAGTLEVAVRPSSVPWGSKYLRYPYLSNLAVRSKLRRQGIAVQLLLNCERVVLGWGFHDIYLHVLENNYQARQLYFKLGYRLHQIDTSWSDRLFGKPQQILLHKYLP
jgi:ribosomal protein S18 acetylase RimI-like enzyme